MVALDPPSTSDAPSSTPGPTSPGHGAEPGPPEERATAPSKPLDILFLQDATGSQGPYIKSARSAINDICAKVSSSASLAKGALRFGLIAFRDHPPQDSTFVTKNYGFTSDTEQMKKNLAGLTATGGGDAPEASTAALAAALNMEWAEDAVKIVVLITDAPPHGIGESGDGFPDKSPDQNDPLDIARQMAELGITLYVIACEPSLSSFLHAVDFYRALCQITSGRMVPLLNASQLGDYIVGSALETIETEGLISEFQKTILDDVYGQGKSVDDVMKEVQAKLDEKKTEVNAVNVEDAYTENDTANANVAAWLQAPNIASARAQTKPITGGRLKPSFASRAGQSFVRTRPPAPPPAPSLAPSLRPRPAPPSAPVLPSGGDPASVWTAPEPWITPPAPYAPTTALRESESSDDFGDDSDSDSDTTGARGPALTRPIAPVSAAPPPPPTGAPRLHSPLMSLSSMFTAVGGSTPGARSRAKISTKEAKVALAAEEERSAPPPAAPAASAYAPQAAGYSQTKRVVMQSLMRGAKVGPGGVLTPKGEYEGKAVVTVKQDQDESTKS